MENIVSNKRTLNNQLIFKLSQIGFALSSDLCYTNRIQVGIHDYVEYVAQLKHGDKLFISTTETKVPIHMIVSILKARDIKLIFYIMEEPLVSFDTLTKLHSVAIRVFVQNNIYDLPNVHIMPIGIRDCGTIVSIHSRFNQKHLLENGSHVLLTQRDIKCILCFSLYTHPSRQECYDLVKQTDNVSSYIFNLNDDESMKEIADSRMNANVFYEKIPENIVYEKTRISRYALCPRGCGLDTHRFYECIYLGCVPIVIRTNSVFDRLYAPDSGFPCLVIDKWADITEELLDSEYPACWRRMCDFHAKYPRFLTDIDSIQDLLLRL